MAQLAVRSSADLTRYNAQRGLQTIAIAEAAERHYARAKDATQLQRAIRAKLEAQAEFVTWWDARDKNKAGRPKKSITGLLSILKDKELAQKLGTRLMTISRWRLKLTTPESFEATYDACCARYPKILEFQTIAHVGQNSGENEWYTPGPYIEAARKVLGAIDLDPASSDAANAVVKARRHFTLKHDGLKHDWRGRVWLNPPYAQPIITRFCEKLAVSVKAGAVPAAVVLVNNATETEWFRTVVGVAAAICFPSGRIRFWSQKNDTATPLQGQAVLYVGKDIDRFADMFAEFGFVVVIRR